MDPVSERRFIQKLNRAQRALCDAAAYDVSARDTSAPDTSAPDTSGIFRKLSAVIVEQAAQLLDSPRCELYIHDDEGELTCCATSSEGPSGGTDVGSEYGRRVACAVVTTGEPVLVDRYDLWADPASVGQAAPFKTTAEPRSALALPIQHQDDLYAVLSILSSASSPFSSMDVEWLSLFAAQAASAIRYVEAQQALIREGNEARDIVDKLPTGVILVDPQMRVVRMNAAAEEIAGCASSEAIGRRLPELFGMAQQGWAGLWDVRSPLHQAMSTGQPIKPTVASLVRGTFARGRAGSDADARRILVGIAPIDEGYLLSLHSGGSFYRTKADRVSGLSHDVRAPLATIRAYTELLIDGIDEGDPDMRQLFLETIDQQAGYLTDLIVNLTDLVRLELGYLQPLKTRISLIDVAKEAIDCFQVQARQQNVPLILDSPEELPPVAADRDMLNTLFKALISNAIKFSMSRGEVVVSLRSDEEKQIITIADQGIGIADHDLPRIFDAFYRGRAAIEEDLEGIGVGLTLAKAIAEAHNGGIDVESSSRGTRDHPEARGTRFAVWLPSEQGPEFRP